MGLGLIGAIGGAGEGLQKQGAYWAEEKKQARIAEMKESYALKAEGRAEERKIAGEARAEERAIGAESRAMERQLAKEKRETERSLASEQRAEGRAMSREEREAERRRADRRDAAAVELESARTRKKEGLLTTSQPRPRSPAEDYKVYQDDIKAIREQNKFAKPEDKIPEPSFDEWREKIGLDTTERSAPSKPKYKPGTKLRGKDGKIYVVNENGVPELKGGSF